MFSLQATDGQDRPDSDAGAAVGGVAKEGGVIAASDSHVTPDQSDSAETGSPPSTQTPPEADTSPAPAEQQVQCNVM